MMAETAVGQMSTKFIAVFANVWTVQPHHHLYQQHQIHGLQIRGQHGLQEPQLKVHSLNFHFQLLLKNKHFLRGHS